MDDGTQPTHVAQVERYEYNSFEKVTKATDAVGRVTSYVYAPNKIDLIDVFQRNPTGARVDPDGQNADLIFHGVYNGSHQPLTTTDASGQLTTYTYTASQQMETIKNAKNETTTYAYGPATNVPAGYLKSITSPAVDGISAVTAFEYDLAYQVSKQTESDGYYRTFLYDNLDRPTKVTYPDATFEQFVYTDAVRGMSLDLTGMALS